MIFWFLECASSSLDSSLRLWDLESGNQLSSIEVGPVDIWTVVFSPDDKFIVSGSHAGKIHMYGTESCKQEQTLDTRGGKFTLSVAYVRIRSLVKTFFCKSLKIYLKNSTRTISVIHIRISQLFIKYLCHFIHSFRENMISFLKNTDFHTMQVQEIFEKTGIIR